MLTLDRRPCKLGMKATADGKEKDGAEIKTLAIELDSIFLEARELNIILSEPHAWDVLFNAGAHPPEPFLKSLKAIELKDSTEHAYVEILFGLTERQIIFTDCKLSKVKLEPQVGGLTAMSCKVTALPVLNESLAQLVEQLGKPVECVIRAQPPGAQQELPLKFGVDEIKQTSPTTYEGKLQDGTKFTATRSKSPKRKAPPKAKRKSSNQHAAH